jgi:hypothetical protein
MQQRRQQPAEVAGRAQSEREGKIGIGDALAPCRDAGEKAEGVAGSR